MSERNAIICYGPFEWLFSILYRMLAGQLTSSKLGHSAYSRAGADINLSGQRSEPNFSWDIILGRSSIHILESCTETRRGFLNFSARSRHHILGMSFYLHRTTPNTRRTVCLHLFAH